MQFFASKFFAGAAFELPTQVQGIPGDLGMVPGEGQSLEKEESSEGKQCCN